MVLGTFACQCLAVSSVVGSLSFKGRTVSCDPVVVREAVARVLAHDIATAQCLGRQVHKGAPPEELLEPAPKPGRILGMDG